MQAPTYGTPWRRLDALLRTTGKFFQRKRVSAGALGSAKRAQLQAYANISGICAG